jgi:hypothetical protein
LESRWRISSERASGFLLEPLFAVDQSQLVGNARVSRGQFRGFLQPFFGGFQVTLFEVGVAQIIGCVRKRRLSRSLAQIPDGPLKVAAIQVQPSEVVQNVGVVTDFAAHNFELLACLVGLMQLEQRNRQGKPGT